MVQALIVRSVKKDDIEADANSLFITGSGLSQETVRLFANLLPLLAAGTSLVIVGLYCQDGLRSQMLGVVFVLGFQFIITAIATYILLRPVIRKAAVGELESKRLFRLTASAIILSVIGVVAYALLHTLIADQRKCEAISSFCMLAVSVITISMNCIAKIITSFSGNGSKYWIP